MSYRFSYNNPELLRYKIVAVINGEQCIFRRYGTDQDKVKKEFYEFVRSMYESYPEIELIELDKTHPAEK